MPVKTERTMNQYGFTEETALNHYTDGIYRNFWSENEWVNDVLKDFNIIEHFVEPVNPAIGNFDEVFIVIKRVTLNQVQSCYMCNNLRETPNVQHGRMKKL